MKLDHDVGVGCEDLIGTIEGSIERRWKSCDQDAYIEALRDMIQAAGNEPQGLMNDQERASASGSPLPLRETVQPAPQIDMVVDEGMHDRPAGGTSSTPRGPAPGLQQALTPATPSTVSVFTGFPIVGRQTNIPV